MPSVRTKPLHVPGEDFPPTVSLAATLVGTAALALWFVLSPREGQGAETSRSAASATTSQQARMLGSAVQAGTSAPGASTRIDQGPQPSAAQAEAQGAAQCEPLVILFPKAVHDVGPADALRLRALAEQLAADASAKLLVRGHADGAGPELFNLQLSFQRADAVTRVLTAAGIARNQITVQGFGEYAPLDGVAPAEGANRRATVDFKVGARCPLLEATQ
jgi:outer membrane protein OmpA-like peptidoglycan-associated protein